MKLISNEIYDSTFRTVEKLGLGYYLFDPEKDDLPICDMLMMESCSNPHGKIIDGKKLHNYPGLKIIDNSWLSVSYNAYIKLHADVVVESATKYMSGGKVIMGIATGSKKHMAPINDLKIIMGVHISPFDCWLMCDSLKTLKLRLEKSERETKKFLKFVEKDDRILSVFHPRASYHTNLKEERRKMMPSVLTLYTKYSVDSFFKFIPKIEKIKLATSYGKKENLIDPWALKYSEDPNNATIRFAIGYGGGAIKAFKELLDLLESNCE